MAEKKKVKFSVKLKRFFKNLRKKWKNSKKSTKAIIITVSVLVVLAIVAAIVVNHYFGLVDINKVDFTDDYVDDDPTTFSTIYDINTATSLDELVNMWYNNNGEKMRSKNVLNVLLMATDSRNASTLDSGNSDTLMLVSLNKETKKITLVSFFRDSYTYANIDGNSLYTKVTEVHGYGGPVATIKTLENDYKIKIDGYATINFTGFEKVVDALGGIDVPVTKAEAAFLASGRHGAPETPVYVNASDSTHLNGYGALWFARIRYLDSDIERTRRQRLVIDAVIQRFSSASVSEINSAVTKFLPYVSTSFSKTDIIKYATTALTQGWANFERVSVEMPSEANRASGYVGTKWMWIVDYPACAQELQNLLYGQTNIVLQSERKTAIDLKSTAKKATASQGTTEAAPIIEESTTQSVIQDSGEKETKASEDSTEKMTMATQPSTNEQTTLAPETKETEEE